MDIKNFNEESEKPEFITRANPLVSRSYQICQFKPEKGDYEPVGSYTVLDLNESQELTEGTLVNLMALMNGRKRRVNLKGLTNTRILFNIIPDSLDEKDHKVIFRSHDGAGVSIENAIMIIEKGVFDGFTS